MRIILMSLAAAAIPLTSFALAAPASAQAQQAKVDGRAAAEGVRKLLNEQYVLTELRPKFDAILAKGIADGRYDVAEPDELVKRINADLAKVTPDKHLGVMYDPEQARQLAAAPPGAGADDAPPSAEDIAAADRRNHGLVQMRVLPGNIRYLESDGFVWAGKASERAYADAMRFLAGGDAVIIDMRPNGGGSPDAVRYMVSHFMEANRPLMTFHMGSNKTDTTATLATLDAPRMVGKPLYVISGPGSASAAEEFLGHVAGYRLGEIIGETSAGAGFRNEFFPIPGGLVISVSVGRAVLASTGKDWEGVGIKPTTEVALDKALDVAQLHALRNLAATAQPARKKQLDAAATLLAAKVDPVTPALPLSAYAGSFGPRSIAAKEGKLVYHGPTGHKFNMIALGPNEFTLEEDPTLRIKFAVNGSATTGFEMIRGDGTKLSAPRSQ
jgi:hypothetical protein